MQRPEIRSTSTFLSQARQRSIVVAKPFVLRRSTRYPWDGRVEVTVAPQAPRRFALRIRIPGWARNEAVPSDLYRFAAGAAPAVKLAINGQSVPVILEQGFALLDRDWTAGDCVELNLPMPARRVLAHEAVADDKGRIAIQRGPLVYCVEASDNGGPRTVSPCPIRSSWTRNGGLHYWGCRGPTWPQTTRAGRARQSWPFEGTDGHSLLHLGQPRTAADGRLAAATFRTLICIHPRCSRCESRPAMSTNPLEIPMRETSLVAFGVASVGRVDRFCPGSFSDATPDGLSSRVPIWQICSSNFNLRSQPLRRHEIPIRHRTSGPEHLGDRPPLSQSALLRQPRTVILSLVRRGRNNGIQC